VRSRSVAKNLFQQDNQLEDFRMKRSLFFTMIIFSLLPVLFGASEKITARTKVAHDETAELQKKLRKSPSDVRLRVKLGLLLLREENYDAALTQFDSALALQPDLPAAKFGRAEVNFLQGHRDESLRGYIEALDSPEADHFVSDIAQRFGSPYAVRQITMAPGENMMARFAPNGRTIVFQSNRDGNWEIYRAYADGSQPARLTNDAAADESPCVSPDGRWIAFARAQEKSRPSGQAAARDIYMMDAQTGHGLIRISPNSADDWNPAFSPKGERLAFVSDRDDARPADRNDRQSDIFLFSLSDSSLTRFSQGFGDKSAPCFTPDGASLVYVNNVNGAFEVFEQHLTSAQPDNLFPKNGSHDGLAEGRPSKGGPQISSDGKRIVYFEKRDQSLDLFLFDRAKNNVQRLTCDPTTEAFPFFSPDGNEIFFTSNRSGGYQIYAMDMRQPIARTELAETLRRLLGQQKSVAQ
jgi:Tol biopolymer transport system component